MNLHSDNKIPKSSKRIIWIYEVPLSPRAKTFSPFISLVDFQKAMKISDGSFGAVFIVCFIFRWTVFIILIRSE